MNVNTLFIHCFFFPFLESSDEDLDDMAIGPGASDSEVRET